MWHVKNIIVSIRPINANPFVSINSQKWLGRHYWGNFNLYEYTE
jgi:hypothetical protein